ACSSSLVAINAACKAIVAGECSRAVAGGTNVITSPYDYRNLAAAGFLSPTGQCKPFDADGDGYCRAEGVGLIVLKSLATAIEENDHILGTIASSAVSQSLNRSQITVPNGESQVALHRRAMRIAGLRPNDVSYIEAHGTGTSVGDPIEMSSIREAFCQSPRSSTLYVASIKGNIGHTEASAGVAGLIKVLLMMSHDSIPEQASHSSLNPRIPALEPDMMAIPRRLTPWCRASRVACVTP
ncbi:MAG: polyketide synthase, partial [Alphaproteobacteria bacterium]